MKVTVEQLKANFATKEVDELLELRAKDQLTDVARSVIEEELRTRGVGESSVSNVRAQQEAQRLEKEKLVSNTAPRSARFIAILLDVYGGLALLAAINFPLFLYTPKAFYGTVGVIAIALYLGYLLFKDAWGGQSAGKRLLRIEVIDKASGQTCSVPKSFLRNLLHIFGIFDWVFIFGKESRRLGDIAADTCVVWK